MPPLAPAGTGSRTSPAAMVNHIAVRTHPSPTGTCRNAPSEPGVSGCPRQRHFCDRHERGGSTIDMTLASRSACGLSMDTPRIGFRVLDLEENEPPSERREGAPYVAARIRGLDLDDHEPPKESAGADPDLAARFRGLDLDDLEPPKESARADPDLAARFRGLDLDDHEPPKESGAGSDLAARFRGLDLDDHEPPKESADPDLSPRIRAFDLDPPILPGVFVTSKNDPKCLRIVMYVERLTGFIRIGSDRQTDEGSLTSSIQRTGYQFCRSWTEMTREGCSVRMTHVGVKIVSVNVTGTRRVAGRSALLQYAAHSQERLHRDVDVHRRRHVPRIARVLA